MRILVLFDRIYQPKLCVYVVCSWFLLGFHLVSTWFLLGVCRVCLGVTWFPLGFHLVSTWFLGVCLGVLGVYLVSTWFLLGFHLVSICCLLCVFGCTWFLVGFHLVSTWFRLGFGFVSASVFGCTWFPLGFHLVSTWFRSGFGQFSIWFLLRRGVSRCFALDFRISWSRKALCVHLYVTIVKMLLFCMKA
jgi:hypothetical protein